MITINTDSTFIQVKSDNLGIFAWQNGTVPEVGEMTTQHTVERSSVLSSSRCKHKLGKETRRLDCVLLNAIDETLKHVFKGAGTEVVYNYIENKFHLKREEIAEKPDEFSAGLERLLSSAAPMIEKMTIENLYSKLELKFVEKKGNEFSDYIKDLRNGKFDR